jgi:hypothetical protein
VCVRACARARVYVSVAELCLSFRHFQLLFCCFERRIQYLDDLSACA